MKNRIFLLVLTLLFVFPFSSNGQALQEGNFVIDPYFGFPNFGKNLARTIAEETDDSKISGLGPWGLRMEYMIGDEFGITVDGIHNSFGVKAYDTPDYISDQNGNQVENNQEYEYKVTMNRWRIQLGFNYHFDLSNEKLDAYAGAAGGTNMRFWSATTTEPNYNYEDDVSGQGTLFPASFRIRLGARYYFTDNIGANLELGLGGPLLSGGLSIKL